MKENNQTRLELQSNIEITDKEETGIIIKTDINKTIFYQEYLTIEKFPSSVKK